jgi:hypothetical protein
MPKRLIGAAVAIAFATAALADEAAREDEKPSEPADLLAADVAAGVVFDGPACLEIARKERYGTAVFVRVLADGCLQFKQGEWNDASLAAVGQHLERAAKAHDDAMRAKDCSGFEDVAGSRVSTLFVSIDVDPEMPWQHLQWVLHVVAAQRFYKVELVLEKRALLVRLPLPRAAGKPPAAPPKVAVGVRFQPRGAVDAKWGDVDVRRPSGIDLFAAADQPLADLAAVASRIRATRESAAGPGAIVVGDLRAANKVPVRTVFDVLDTFVDEGVGTIEINALRKPTEAARTAARLPYPDHNYGE